MSEGRCTVRFMRRYREPPAAVWLALTEPASLARWLGPGFDVERRVLLKGRVLELDWRPPGEEDSLVRVELSPDGGGTLLVLEHSRIDAELGMRYLSLWTGALAHIPLEERP